MPKIQEIENFAFPSENLPKKKDDLLLRIIFVLALFGAGLGAFLISHP